MNMLYSYETGRMLALGTEDEIKKMSTEYMREIEYRLQVQMALKQEKKLLENIV